MWSLGGIKDLKKDGKRFKMLITTETASNGDTKRGKKRIANSMEQLANKRYKTEEDRGRTIREPLTYPAWEEEAAKTKHGSLTPQQARHIWEKELASGGAKTDHKGVVQGMAGCQRLWMPVGEQMLSDKVVGSELSHTTASKAKGKLSPLLCGPVRL